MVNGVFIRKSKKAYAEEVSKMKSSELFGVKSCGVTWNGLFKKHMAFDLIKCVGVSVNNEACIESVLEKECNC